MNDLAEAVATLNEQLAMNLVRIKLDAGESTFDILEQCRIGVEMVGKRYQEEQYFISDLVMSEEIVKSIVEIIEPYFPISNNARSEPLIVIGTIKGDIHDLGKNIVISLLRSAGYTIHDLGVDVGLATFVDAVRHYQAQIVCVSVLLTTCFSTIRELNDLLVQEQLRNRVTLAIGGYPVDSWVKKYTGADLYCRDARDFLSMLNNKTMILKK